jgi:SET domain-containing protein
MLYRSKKIYVDDSPIHGRGVFASEFIKSGEILEECHFIKVPIEVQYPKELYDHFFAWPKRTENHYAVVLGYGSIFNHSDQNNASWETDPSRYKFIFFATRDIEPGEEICTNYEKVVDF